MADIDINGPYDFVDKRVARGVNGASVLTGANNYDNINDLRVVLFGISATKYSSIRLDGMTKNDMVYAYRLEVDSAGVR
jgi:hypothetical protein